MAKPRLWLCVLALLFVALAGAVTRGRTLAMDTRIVRALRSADDPSRPIGPRWLEGAMLDLTALGSPTVLGLLILSIGGFLVLQSRPRAAAVILVTSVTGDLLGRVMKALVARPRPTVVPHLRDVVASSFPSGHAMESAIVFLTLGAMLAEIADRRAVKIYCLSMAIVLSVLVGVSRVFLGVHYPTDVIGGWMVGALWASICWFATSRA
jgi:undecaprenyl-diphosphatase